MFKVGDLVRVKEDAETIDANVLFVRSMRKYLGQEHVIANVIATSTPPSYQLAGVMSKIGFYWNFTEAWLEPAYSTNINIKEDDIGELLCMK